MNFLNLGLWSPGVAPVYAQVKQVTEVRYVGLSKITPRDLEGILPFSPGDQWKDEFINLTEKTLTEYYARRGFYKAKVTAYINPQTLNSESLVLVVRVDEGPPTLIKSFILADPPGFKSKSVMNRFKEKMYKVAKIQVGERYDEQLLQDHLRELREWLISENFILANTDAVRVVFGPDKSNVDVFANIDFGDRVTFGFSNNSVFTKGELNEIIAQLRTTGLGKDYVGAIQRKFIEEYRGKAYFDIKIETQTVDRLAAKHVIFVFDEGVRYRIDEIKWDGLSDANVSIVQDVFGKSVSRLVQRGYFVERDIDKGIQVVIEDLQSKGYLFAKLVSKNIQVVKKGRVKVLIQIIEGEQTYVGEIELDGFRHFSRSQILEALGLEENKPFNPFGAQEGIQKINKLYVSEGFLNFNITTAEDVIATFAENNRIVNIRLQVQEGPRIKVGAIRIEGLSRTRPYIVEREISIQSEDWWVANKVQDTEDNLRRLGLFADVKIKPVTSSRGPEYRDMVIDLREAEHGLVELVPGLRYDLGLRTYGKISYANIAGKNWVGTLTAEANRRLNDQYRFVEYKFDASFIEPRLFGTRNLYTLGVSTRKQRFPPDFNASTTQIYTGIERRLFQPLTVKLFYRLERIRQFDVYVDNVYHPQDNQTMLIGSFAPSLSLDTRDSPFTTTRGTLSTFTWEYAHPHLSAQKISEPTAAAYHRAIASTHFYIPLPANIVWSNVVAGGYARSNVAGRPIPLIKLFRLGGYSTIRGFSEDSINVDKYSITGTLTYVNLRTQVDLPFFGELRFAPFLDAGNLFIDNIYRGSPFFRAGAGAGLHYMTPIGPLNLDWGYKLNRVGEESQTQIHFSVGLI